MKFLHIWQNEKFTESYIDFINNNFNSDEHLFLIIGKGVGAKITPRENVREISDISKKDMTSLWTVTREMYRSKKIFLHGLFITNIVRLLFFQPWLLKKCNWIIWGGDLYHYKFRKKDFRSDLHEFFRKYVIKNMGSITTMTKGDFKLAQEWYVVKGKHCQGIYISPVDIEFLDKLARKERLTSETIKIQIGNSADPSNKHLEVFDILSRFKNENIDLFVPLSYGDKEYASTVTTQGKKIFGNKFRPLLDFLEPEQYFRYLSSINIAIFANERQQALGNIYALLYLGKKVYIRNDISTWDYLKNEMDIDLSNYLSLINQSFDHFVKFDGAKPNKEKARFFFSHDYYKKVWETIFIDGKD